MRRLVRGYSIHLRSRAALIRRNDDFGIGTHGKAYLFSPFVGPVGANLQCDDIWFRSLELRWLRPRR
jgi:hypothetical protein